MRALMMVFNCKRDFSCADHVLTIELGNIVAYKLDYGDAGDLDNGAGIVYTVTQKLFDQLYMLAELTQHQKRSIKDRSLPSGIGAAWYAISTDKYKAFIDLLKKP